VVIGLAVYGTALGQGALDPPPMAGQPQPLRGAFPPPPAAMPQQPNWPAIAAQPMPAPQPSPTLATYTPMSPPSPAPIVPPTAPNPMPHMMPPAPVQPAAMPATPPAPAAMPAVPMGQGVQVEKRGPAVVNLGKPYAYEIVVRNASAAVVHHVRVEDELPAGARYTGGDPPPDAAPDRLAWSLNTLEPGAERRLRVQLQLAAEGEIRSEATVHYAATASLRTQVVQPKLVLAMRGPEQATAGVAAPFQIIVSNPGTGPVTNLVLRGKLPEGLTHVQGRVVEAEMGSLAPGESRSVTLTTQAAKCGQFVNEMIATGDDGLEAKAQAPITVVGPTLALQRTGPAKCYLKSEIGFELEVGNSGSVAAGYVEVADTLPGGLEFVSATEGGRYDAVSRTVAWRLPALQPGGRQRVAYRVKATNIGEMPDRAAARADRGGDVKADGTFTVEGVPALSLEVVDLEDPIEVGADLTYEIRVVNQGSCPCTNIQISAQAPEGLTPLEGTGPTAYAVAGPQVTFEPLSKLAVKADAVFRVKVRGMVAGDYRFRVQMTCDQLRQPVMKEEASRVYKDGQ
jgi:uncharacterized repeat protein (TIGR01451 family)